MDSEQGFKLVFLTYLSRSGSTFLADRLGRHPEVLVTPESNFVPRLVKFFESNTEQDFYASLTKFLFQENKFIDWGLSEEELENYLRNQQVVSWGDSLNAILEYYRSTQKPGASVVIIKKSGWYAQNADFLMKSLRDSSFIYLIRDPRGVYNSARNSLHSETGKPLAKNFLNHSRKWNQFLRNAKSFKRAFEQRVLIVKYEKILYEPEVSFREVWQFCGVRLPAFEEINEFIGKKEKSHLITPRTSHLHENVSKKPLADNAYKWRRQLSCHISLAITLLCIKGILRCNYRIYTFILNYLKNFKK